MTDKISEAAQANSDGDLDRAQGGLGVSRYVETSTRVQKAWGDNLKAIANNWMEPLRSGEDSL